MGWFGGGSKRRGASPQHRAPQRELERQQRKAQKQRAERHREREQKQRAQEKAAQRAQKQAAKRSRASEARSSSREARSDNSAVRAPKPAVQKARAVRGERPSRAWGQLWSSGAWRGRAMPVLALSLVGALVLGGWWMLHVVGSEPVSRVLFTGTLKHVDRDELVARTQPLLIGEGFMTADLEAIRSELLQLPWIASVSVRRQWPSQLVVAVSEQEPIARWGSDGLLNRRGQVFRPQPLGAVDELPALFGPDAAAADVVARYAELSALLAGEGLRLVSLGTDRRGSWRAELDGGVQLRLGTGELLEKLRRFARVYRAELQPRFGEIAYVDLRYSNGLAIGWRATHASNAAGNQTTASAARHMSLALDNTERTLGEMRNG